MIAPHVQHAGMAQHCLARLATGRLLQERKHSCQNEEDPELCEHHELSYEA